MYVFTRDWSKRGPMNKGEQHRGRKISRAFGAACTLSKPWTGNCRRRQLNVQSANLFPCNKKRLGYVFKEGHSEQTEYKRLMVPLNSPASFFCQSSQLMRQTSLMIYLFVFHDIVNNVLPCFHFQYFSWLFLSAKNTIAHH